MISKEINKIFYCKRFIISDESIVEDLKLPEPGRVYEAHYSQKHDEYIIRVMDTDKNFNFCLSGNPVKNDYYDYEFLDITSDNIESLDFHDDDLDLIEGFLSNKESKPISLEDGLVVDYDDEATSIASIGYMSAEDEDKENGETEDFIEKIMKMAKDETERLDSSVKAMNLLLQRDPVFARTIQDLLIFLSASYQTTSTIDLTKFITSEDGKAFSIGSAVFNLSKYMSNQGGAKEDLLKAIQFCLFELTRIKDQQ